MQVSYTIERDDTSGADYYMVVATKEEWEEIMRNVDGIGHSRAMLDLLRGLKNWGMRK
jgi:hypothetical protein